VFKKLAITLGILSVTTLSVYTIKLRMDIKLLLAAVEDMTDSVDQYVTDVEFANIVEGLGDIDG